MPIVIANPSVPVIEWEEVSANNTAPFDLGTGWYNAKMWLLPDNNTLLVANGSLSSTSSREVATLDLTTMLWTSKNDISGSAKLGSAVYHPVNNTPMIMGVSDTERQIYEYTSGTDTWTTTFFFPVDRKHNSSPATNLPNGDVILLGSIAVGQFNIASSWDGTTLNALPDVPTSPVSTRGHSNLFASGTKVYMIGNRENSGSFLAIDNVYRYDTNLGTWDASITMPEPHQQSIVIPLDSTRCMVIGGSEAGAGGGSAKTYIFDASTETFTSFGVESYMPASGTPTSMGLNLGQGIVLSDGKVLAIVRNGTGTDLTIYRTVNTV